MKYVVLISRLLLGLIFFVFGLNNILHFIHLPPPSGEAGTLMTILVSSHWMTFVGCIMVVSGLLFLVGRFIPLALTLTAPVVVNILLYHLLLEPHGLVPGAVVTVLEVVLILAYWRNFFPLFAPDAKPDPKKI